MPSVKEKVWKMFPGREFAEDIEFNEVTEDGDDFDLTSRVVIVTIGDTVYRSDTDSQLTIASPATAGVAEFRLSDAESAEYTEHQYELKVDVENDTGYTTPYIRGIVSMET